MANTLPGTPYVESSDLVANYPAVSESLAERVDLVGILPFATSTARGTALPTPTDGQYTYLQDTNSTEFWNGSAWQSAGIDPGLRIVAPTSIANSGGSASASGGAVTFTGVSSVSLNGVFTSAYENYRILVVGTASADLVIQLRYRTSGTDESSANYRRQTLGADSTTVYASRATGTTETQIGNFTTDRGSLAMDVFSPAIAANTTYFSQITARGGGSLINMQNYCGALSTSTQYDGFTIYPTAGNFTGTIRVYGYKNS